jgi:hypothetical protein
MQPTLPEAGFRVNDFLQQVLHAMQLGAMLPVCVE